MKISFEDCFGFAEYRRAASGKWILRPRWRRIGIALVTLGLVIYLAQASFLFYRDRYVRKIKETSFPEMLVYPFSREVQAERRNLYSDELIGEAKQETDPHKGFNLVRRGLLQNAGQPDGRIFYSYVLFLQRRPRAALEFLREGLATYPDTILKHPEYVRFFARQCLTHFEDTLLIETADAFSAHPSISPENRFVLCSFAAQAEIALGRFKAAETRLSTPPLSGTDSAAFLKAHIERERGNTHAAISILQSLKSRSPNLDLAIARDLREVGESERALELLTKASLMAREDPSALAQIIDELAKIKLPAAAWRRDALEKDFFERYKTDPTALRLLCVYAAKRDDIHTVEYCRAQAESRVFPNFYDFILIYVETLLRSGDVSRACKELDKIFADKELWVKEEEAVLNGLNAVALYANGERELGEMFLSKAQNDTRLSVAQTIAISRAFRVGGNAEIGLRVLESRFELEPHNPVLLHEILDYAATGADPVTFSRYAPKLIGMRRPPRELLEKFLRFARSDCFFFSPDQEKVCEFLQNLLTEKSCPESS